MRILVASLLFVVVFTSKLKNINEPKCHPQCGWKCDDPKCPAICDPVCEPPKCHTACQEPRNAVCDVKCEKPSCEVSLLTNNLL